jgi:hypothetical protein
LVVVVVVVVAVTGSITGNILMVTMHFVHLN